jgi:hypothetical protein
LVRLCDRQDAAITGHAPSQPARKKAVLISYPMRFHTFLVTGIEVLHQGGQNWQSNMWPPEHWRANKGRWRLFTPGIDDYVTSELKDRNYGNLVEGLVVALEVADFKSWPSSTFAKVGKAPSFKRTRRDIWCFAKLDWKKIQRLTLSEQYQAYCNSVLASVGGIRTWRNKPKGFDIDAFETDLRDVFSSGRVSQMTRAASERAVPAA